MASDKVDFVVDNSKKSYLTVIMNAHLDFMTIWLSDSPMPVWVRCWLFILMAGSLSPFAFLPHPYAITNVVGLVVILMLNGRELARVRGVNKNMGWPHVIAWIPVLTVDVLSLFTSKINDQQLTLANAGDNAYHQALFFFVWLNFIALGISCLLDIGDTIAYHCFDMKQVDRSMWTIEQLKQENAEKKPKTEKVNLDEA